MTVSNYYCHALALCSGLFTCTVNLLTEATVSSICCDNLVSVLTRSNGTCLLVKLPNKPLLTCNEFNETGLLDLHFGQNHSSASPNS